MSFLTLDSQKSLFKLKKAQLQFEWTVQMNRYNALNRQAADYANSMDDDWEADEDPLYIALQKEEEFYQLQADSLKSQIDVMDQEINNMKTMVQNDLKSSCALNLVGGG